MVVAAKATINANVHLIASGVLVSDEANTDASLSDTYRWLKIGDRETFEDGMTICFIPIVDPVEARMTGGLVQRAYEGQITAYFQGGTGSDPARSMADPNKRELARRGIVEEFRKLFNGIPARTLDCGAAGTLYSSYIGAAHFGTLMNDSVQSHVVAMDWTAKAFADETTTG